MPKIKINIFGEGVEFKRLYLPDDTIADWRERAERKQSSLSDKIIDPFFFYDLKHPLYSSLEVIPSQSISGMLDNPKNQLEIWFDRKKVMKWHAADLFSDMLLFPLFQIRKEILEEEFQSGIIIQQRERGQLATLELNVEEGKLNLDAMQFTIKNGLGNNFLTDISYKNKTLKFLKKETLIVGQSAIELL
ncbi:hypothetical protein FSS13T_01190 [Flavobacterium saliperosum S13]|uniref:Uncharacterized protein n=2 Tax=Flavobacterium saliperosum TaxID=329186 RepID=A0A1G4V407_9FLAO|nr:hypothetical protein [Flavobacterium saliperosum]ESU27650.1 hypothetical protein FSS13T_01190 [Flavobacterium saliperosum S13]SCX00235.1 hypothetical protein SAMN02927925_00125 [Flavobacterium saliperosum]